MPFVFLIPSMLFYIPICFGKPLTEVNKTYGTRTTAMLAMYGRTHAIISPNSMPTNDHMENKNIIRSALNSGLFGDRWETKYLV